MRDASLLVFLHARVLKVHYQGIISFRSRRQGNVADKNVVSVGLLLLTYTCVTDVPALY